MVQIVDDMCRMRMLMAGVYVGIAISSTYGFSVFTAHLKNKYGMSQSDITTISTVGNCVNYASFFAGMLFDHAGPMVVLPLAGFLAFLGFFLFGLTFNGVIENPTVVHFSIYQGIAHLGLPALDVAAVMPLMLQFPADRGYVVMIQKTFSGLGTSVLMAYFNGWFKSHESNNTNDNDYSGYAFFLGAQILVCSLVGTYFIRLPMYFPCSWRKNRLSEEELTERKGTLDLYMKQRAPIRRLRIGYALVVAMLIFCTTQSIATAYVETSRAGYLVVSVVAVVLMASFVVIALPFQCIGRYAYVKPTHMEAIGELIEEEMPHDIATIEAVDGSISACKSETGKEVAKLEPQYAGSFWSHLTTVDLWALWLTCFGTWGTGSVMQMNATQMYSSKNYGVTETSTVTLYVAIMGVGSAIGRMSMGILDLALTERKRAGKPRILTTIALPLGPIMLVLAFLFFALLPQEALILPFLLGSIGNGIGWGGSILAVRMMYERDVGKHYDFLFSSGVVAAIGLNRFMFGGMYDSEARKRGTFPECNDPSCIRSQMFILLAINVVATFAAVTVHWRFARFSDAESHKESISVYLPKNSDDTIATEMHEPLSEGNRMQS